jgi:hypothetical protein
LASSREDKAERLAEDRAGPEERSTFEALTFPFRVRSPSREVADAVEFIYREMLRQDEGQDAFDIEIRRGATAPEKYELIFAGRPVMESSRIGDILHQLDNELTFILENARPDLYFVHAAALAVDGRAVLLVGESGAGKSTTAYAFASSGVEYLSDELAPLEPATGHVHPYPRAICLKQDPPLPLRVPKDHLRTEWTLHVGAATLSARVRAEPAVLDRIYFVKYSPSHGTATLRPLSRGEAALRLYQGALNQLAHPNMGLDDTLRLVRRAECFELLSAGVEETLRAVGRPVPA